MLRVLLRLLPGSGAVFLLWSYGALFRPLVHTGIRCCTIVFLACEEGVSENVHGTSFLKKQKPVFFLKTVNIVFVYIVKFLLLFLKVNP